MADPYPQNFTIEIDRENWYRCMRRTHLLGWCGGLGFFLGFICMTASGAWAEHHYAPLYPFVKIFGLAGLGLVVGVSAGAVLGLGGYALFSRRQVRREADALEAQVKGQFLHVRGGTYNTYDRKLHFHAIIDFTCYQNWHMKRFGVVGIRMLTMGGGLHSYVDLPAVKDAEKVRDMLAEIDRLREDLKPA